jgi:hypothetical protein
MTDNAGFEKALQGTLDRLLDSRLASLRQELFRELQREAAALGGAAGAAQSDRAALSELNQGIARILAPTGQTEIMGACLQGAVAFAGRAVLFVRRGESFAFWRAERLADSAASGLRSASVSATEPGIFQEIAATQQAVVKSRSAGMPAAIEKALGESADGDMGLFPVAVAGRLVAALYADAGNSAGSFQPEAIQILARFTGLSLETAAGRAAAGASRPVATAGAPEKAAGPVVEESPAAAEAPEPAVAAEAPATPHAGSFAAYVPAASEASLSIPSPPSEDSIPEADREAHKKAYRFARVAVQDLLSYHKNKIEKGRADKNLYTILKDDIGKTRENYRQRFGKTAARSFDYLHYELVSKLAGNDISALGPQYPGAIQGD